MDEKRMVGDYTVINSMYIGHREIILGENPKAASGERYVCCYAERVLFYEQYLEAQVSDDFAEIVYSLQQIYCEKARSVCRCQRAV